jgi:nuclear pore complex protein Nup62
MLRQNIKQPSENADINTAFIVQRNCLCVEMMYVVWYCTLCVLVYWCTRTAYCLVTHLWIHGIYICMYVCIYVRMYACKYICIYICMYVCMCVFMCVCIYVCIYILMYVCMYVRMYACKYVCMYIVCMYVRMYACKYIYICMYVCMCKQSIHSDDSPVSNLAVKHSRTPPHSVHIKSQAPANPPCCIHGACL